MDNTTSQKTSHMSNTSNSTNTKGEGDAKFNKKQFWPYQRLYAKGGGTKHISDSKTNSKTKSNTKTKKKMFHLVNNRVATDKTLVKRLESIYIPPAYKDIVVAKSGSNKIQAIGTDDRGRRQYVYNPKYTKKRNDRKYDFILPLGKKIIQIEKDNENALHVLASKPYDDWLLPNDYIPIIIYMLRTYHFRIGNEKYAIENNSYGITTLKKQHIKFDSKNSKIDSSNTSNSHKISIEFVGKKGVINRYTDNDPNPMIIKLLKTLIEHSNPDGFLFKYYNNKNYYNNNDDSHDSHDSHDNHDNHKPSKVFITPEHIHSFFQIKYNSEITPKMFRTWYGNYHMLEHLRDLYNNGTLKIKMTKVEINKIINVCSEHVSSKLNNTPTVSKQSYIDNKIIDLVMKNPYRFASKIPNNSVGQHKFLYKIILKLRHNE
uniref:DNA topoisomerase n=1 Tax=viral metagenome TaxID=1070528 RepID=A0A6C0F0I9_9ZZZZ